MTVYVDDMRAKFGRYVMCHMAADTVEELHEMADRIGVARKWYQGPPKTRHEHYDIALTKKALAIEYGAVEVTQREMACYSSHKNRFKEVVTPQEAYRLRMEKIECQTPLSQ